MELHLDEPGWRRGLPGFPCSRPFVKSRAYCGCFHLPCHVLSWCCCCCCQDEGLQTEAGQQEQQLQRLQLEEGMQTEAAVLSRPQSAPTSKSTKSQLAMGGCAGA